MPFRGPHSCLKDIYESICAIETFVRAMDFDALVQDDKTQAAVERKMQVISECAIRLGDDADKICPGLPWHEIRGIGNWLRHEYDKVDAETIWNTIVGDLPPLKSAVSLALKKMSAAGDEADDIGSFAP